MVIFIILAILLELIIHYYFKISIVYTHLFYLIIIIAAIWYQQKAVWIALFFGILHVSVSYYILGTITPEPLFRAIMLCVIAYIVGTVVCCMHIYQDELIAQNNELKKIHEAYQMANKKLNLLSSITRHDILNQLTVILGYIGLLQDIEDNPEKMSIYQKELTAAEKIQKQIEFTRIYQDIGVKAPIWNNTRDIAQNLRVSFHQDGIALSSTVPDVEIFADPLFPSICQNLIDNSLRHGEHVTQILFRAEQRDQMFVLIYEDNGIGVPDHEKEKIFARGYGKHTGMGLFLSQEILAITGLSLKETGTYGSGVRFEIEVPEGSYRLVKNDPL